jgi:cell division initiation protein
VENILYLVILQEVKAVNKFSVYRSFTVGLGGYNKKEVDDYIKKLTDDYEEELSRKFKRLQELTDENKQLKDKITELSDKMDHNINLERRIAKALTEAEAMGERIVEESKRKARLEADNIRKEKDKLESRTNIIRSEILEFEQRIYDIMEKFQSEINYMTSKGFSYEKKDQDKDKDELQEDNLVIMNVAAKEKVSG